MRKLGFKIAFEINAESDLDLQARHSGDIKHLSRLDREFRVVIFDNSQADSFISEVA